MEGAKEPHKVTQTGGKQFVLSTKQWKGARGLNVLPDDTNNTICLYLSSLVVRGSSVAIVALGWRNSSHLTQPFYNLLGKGLLTNCQRKEAASVVLN